MASKRGATRRKAIIDEPIITPKKEAITTNDEPKKPSIVLIIITLVCVSLFIVFLTQLKPSSNKPKQEDKKKPELPTELPPIKPKYDFYEVLPQGTTKFTQDELAKINEAQVKAALQGQIPVPLSALEAQAPTITKDLATKKASPASSNADNEQVPSKQNQAQVPTKTIKETAADNKKVTTKSSTNNTKETKEAPVSKATAKQLYFWQVGSFKNSEDAENMRAKIAIAGQIAQIEISKTKGETWHLVLVGPFRDKAKMITVQQELTRQGFSNLLLQQRAAK